MSLVIVSVMMVTALNAVGASRVGQRWNADRLRALALASDLMAEITSKAYSDPNETPIFGPEPSEVLIGRPAFDDVDDYSGYSESPPMTSAGVAMTGLSSWSRSVTVSWVNPSDLTTPVLVESGCKLITVKVSRAGQTLAQLTAVRTTSGPH
jgi:hypothetical protein